MGNVRKLVVLWGLAFLGCTQTGCLSFCNPLQPLPREELEPYHDIAPCQKDKVHVFFVHGLDPNDISNYTGLFEYVRSLGYGKTYFGWVYHSFLFENEIRALHEQDPEARIVLVGFSYGAGMIRDVACSLRSAGITIDLLFYIDGVEFDHRLLHRPANVARVINILSFNRSDQRLVKEGENHLYKDVWHYATVTHPQTLRLIARELGAIARMVPIVQIMRADKVVPTAPPAAPAHVLPPPNEGTQQKASEWGFLRPDGWSRGVKGGRPAEQAYAIDPAALQALHGGAKQ